MTREELNKMSLEELGKLLKEHEYFYYIEEDTYHDLHDDTIMYHASLTETIGIEYDRDKEDFALKTEFDQYITSDLFFTIEDCEQAMLNDERIVSYARNEGNDLIGFNKPYEIIEQERAELYGRGE